MNAQRELPSAIAVSLLLLLGLSASAQQPPLARTPPMGWNSWYAYGCKVTEAIVRAQADALVSNGMRAAGYEFVNLDDCWAGGRDAAGAIHPNPRFSDMKALGDYIHSKGLKFGLYSSPEAKTCAGFEGSLGHEEQDARTYAAWGADFLKYDNCRATQDKVQEYEKMHQAILKTGRPMLYLLCLSTDMDRVWAWGASVGGNLWRTTSDIQDRWDSMALAGFGQNGLERYAGPGHWNDPDMLQVGNGGMKPDEYRTQMSLWCLLAAPLISSTDLTQLTPAMLAILTNREVIAVDQDPAGIQGRRVAQEGPLEVWMKPLADGSRAVGLFNRGHFSANPVTLRFSDIGVGEKAGVRDLWTHQDLGVYTDHFQATVPNHGVVMLRVRDASR